MSTPTATASGSRRRTSGAGRANARAAARKRAAARRRALRRRLLALVGVVLAVAGAAAVAGPLLDDAVKEVTLPLRHEDIIRQQADDKGLDPALIAGVIYAESRFQNGQTSSAGAQGLMQLTPATAKDIASRSGGTAFRVEDLDTAQVNIAYGSWYLDHLLERYGGNEVLALAAYNGGQGNVDRWIVEARDKDQDLRVQDIPFPETRNYVAKVLEARQDYRVEYRSELGL